MIDRERSQSLLNQGAAAAAAGQRDHARALLREALAADPYNEFAWIWLSTVVDDPNEKRDCLHRALAINPQSQQAHSGLQVLQASQAPMIGMPGGVYYQAPSSGINPYYGQMHVPHTESVQMRRVKLFWKIMGIGIIAYIFLAVLLEFA